jgi:hypothetical protein
LGDFSALRHWKTLPGGPADAQHLVQDASTLDGERDGGQAFDGGVGGGGHLESFCYFGMGRLVPEFNLRFFPPATH